MQIRKLLVVAASVAMPASMIAGVTAVGSSGMAGAAVKVYTSTTCGLGGSVTFAAPGLSNGGTATKKTTSKSTALITPTSGACGATPLTGIGGYATIKAKITSATNPCWATLPTYTSKTVYTGGTLLSGVPTGCDALGNAAATDPGLSATGAKAGAKNVNYYDNASSFVTAGVSSIVTSLGPKGVKAYDGGNKVTLNVGTTGGNTAGSILPGGACGSDAGFSLTGSTSVPLLTYSLAVCLTTDTGGSTGTFIVDELNEISGADLTGVISAATVGGSSNLTFTYTGP
jgi:hypothetical protein